MKGDITIDAARFNPSNIKEDTKQINAIVEKACVDSPEWIDVGAAKYRQMSDNGETIMPKPVLLPGARDTTIPSRETGRSIPLRVFPPENGKSSKGIFLQMHGGGFVLGSQYISDERLQMFANACQLTAISVGYRHAPEDPHPAANHDCFDAAEYLVDHAERDYGARLLFIAGESAGGCLAALTTFHLIQSRPAHRLAGVILLFGVFDLTLGLPQMSLPESTRPLVTNAQMLHNFINAYTPGMSDSDRRDASVSPLYEDMQALADSIPGNSLPAALFLCGTADPLLDDTFLMGMKWMIAGGEAIVKIYPGGAHGFSMFRETKDAEEVAALQIQFVNEKAANEV